MKKLAIIGANGMLGTDLMTHLSPFFSITGITKENYQSFVDKKFDIVINANGNSKRFWANTHPQEDFNLSTISVYKSLFDFHTEMYIYISSSDIYKDHTSIKTTKESQYIEPSDLSSYGLHKYMSELLVKKYSKQYMILRCCLVLGSKLKKGPLYDMLEKQPLYIAKESTLQMITTKAIADSLSFLLKEKIRDKTYNIGGKGIVSFTQIEKFVSFPVVFSKKAEKQQYEMDVSELNAVYPLERSITYLQEFFNSLQSQ